MWERIQVVMVAITNYNYFSAKIKFKWNKVFFLMLTVALQSRSFWKNG